MGAETLESIVWYASEHQAKSQDTWPQMMSLPGLLLLQTCRSVTKKPNGLLISDKERPDGLTLLPWQEGKPLVWEVTIISPLAVSYISGYILHATAELAASRMCAYNANLLNSYIFQPIAFKIWALSTRQPLHLFLNLGTKYDDPR